MIDGSVLQSAQKCFEKESRVVVKMVVTYEQSAVKLVVRVLKSGTVLYRTHAHIRFFICLV